MSSVEIAVEVLPHGLGLPLPAYATEGAAGMDAVAAVEGDFVLMPGARAAVPTGLRMAVPAGYEVQVRARSGLALNAGLIVPNGPGTIDSDYRGEVKVILANISDTPFTITRGMRIAQLLLAPVTRAAWRVAPLDDTARGAGGFGSTGRT
ncbi:dUTP diphosphatase [Sandaracinobacteroides saxicola]|uniref:Deoxyuridine 5'-triphosphate nucleotidohydrolase n=1 Tax=Sandaracinobacteroides saxicola TaxID=2759707 RepID=A0A7G5IH67_9SPHN|nr:dUTP diphosphatase [Sandaracinobacteroides saxicola]QMW22709.1 dUTP diphosphatase [Sandaracinobacteroides saxicola]